MEILTYPQNTFQLGSSMITFILIPFNCFSWEIYLSKLTLIWWAIKRSRKKSLNELFLRPGHQCYFLDGEKNNNYILDIAPFNIKWSKALYMNLKI